MDHQTKSLEVVKQLKKFIKRIEDNEELLFRDGNFNKEMPEVLEDSYANKKNATLCLINLLNRINIDNYYS